MYRREEKAWEQELIRIGALWVHDGNPKRPHALLTSGLHSDCYFNAQKVTRGGLLHDMCLDLIEGMSALTVVRPNMVIGCGAGNAEQMAITVGVLFGVPSGHAKKIQKPDGEERMVLACNIGRGMNVLLVDDVFTTGKTLRRTTELVCAEGASVMKTALFLVNRSTHQIFSTVHLCALINPVFKTWTDFACPLCKEGSKALRPREENNWHTLTSAT